MKSLIFAVILLLTTAVGVYFYPAVNASNPGLQPNVIPPSVIKPISTPIAGVPMANQQKIEVVFVLDTTGSMSGLIQTAKDKIWSIASSMASAQSAPTIRMGVVAYRDRGDDYVTKVVDLNDDLDTVYGQLMDLQAQGGGDGPESVNKGLSDAIHKMSWSSSDQDTYRVVFLVGDAAPHMDYQDEMQYPEIIKLAQRRGIVVNTIQCGNDPETLQSWQQIASLSQGAFFQVGQAGSAVAVSSPYDDEIALLSKELDSTRLYYGDRSIKESKLEKERASKRFNRAAPASAIARKAEFNVSASGARNFEGDNELIADVTAGRIALDSIEESELPSELQKMDRVQQAKVLEEKAERRKALKQKIGGLAAKRSDYVRQELAKTGADKDSLDNKIYEAVREQASEKGLVYSDEAPKY